MLAARWDAPATIIAECVELGLLDPADGGYRVHDYLEYNPGPDYFEVKSKAGQKSAETRWGHTHTTDEVTGALTGVTSNEVSGEVTVPVPVPVPVLVPTKERTGASPLQALDDDERAETLEIAGILGVEPTDTTRVKRIIHTRKKHPQTDGIAVAFDYVIWQENEAADKAAGKKTANVQRDRVSGWVNQMASRCGWDKYQRASTAPPSSQSSYPEFIPTPEQLAQAERQFAEQAARFSSRAVGQA
jgi:hypothetical protein